MLIIIDINNLIERKRVQKKKFVYKMFSNDDNPDHGFANWYEKKNTMIIPFTSLGCLMKTQFDNILMEHNGTMVFICIAYFEYRCI